jgi:DNA-binding CsgD family transcriptional regulator
VTSREAETLAAIGRRLTNREIAAEMFISVQMVAGLHSGLVSRVHRVVGRCPGPQ